MKSSQVKILSDVRFVIERDATSDERRKYKKESVYDFLSLKHVKDLDSKQEYRLIAGVPESIPINEGPAENIEELAQRREKLDGYSLLFFDQMIKLLADTSEISYKSRDGTKKKASLLSTIRKAWSQYLYEYGNIEKEGNILYVNTGGVWTIVSALGEIIHQEKLDDAFIKLQEEGEIRWAGEDFKLRAKAQSLVRRGLARYIPDWPYNIRWELKKFDSFHEFHQTVSSLINKYRVERQEINQPSLILEEAHIVLEKVRQRKGYPEIVYPQKEPDLWDLYQR